MEIKTLEGLSIPEVTQAFNAAFIDYKINLQLTEEEMAIKIKAENIQLYYSAGAFDEGKLVSFILHGVDIINGEKVVYNAGTGTLPSHRNQKLAQRVYGFIISHLQKENVFKHQLEVFDDNTKASTVYINKGFKIKRKLCCFKGKVRADAEDYHNVKEVTINENEFKSFWNFTPTWQNHFPSILRNLAQHKVIGIEENGQLVAYAIYVPKIGRVRQFAVKKNFRKKGYGKQLVNFISKNSERDELYITNVEEDAATIAFLENLGFTRFLDMYEMTLEVKQPSHVADK